MELLCRSLIAVFALGAFVSSHAEGTLRPHPSNPRYFTDDSGKAIFLTGSHVWANLRDLSPSDPPAPYDYDGYLDLLQSKGHNFFRLWSWDLPNSELENVLYYTSPFPWPRTGPGVATDGKPKFNLAQWNQAYFDRLRARVVAAGQRDMYVSIMLFEGYELQFHKSPTDGFPLDGGNNVNGINAPDTTSTTLENAQVTALQEAYVKKIIDTVNDLDNVLYEICNEAGPSSTSWQYHMIDVVKTYQATKQNQHPVGMTFQYPGGSNSTLFNSRADWISPNEGGGYKSDPPVASGSKVVISDTDHLWGHTGGTPEWAWKSFMRGLNTLFMDRGVGTLPPVADWRGAVRDAMGHTRMYAQKMDLAAAVPQNSSTACSTRYCLVNPGLEYLVYQPGSGGFSVNLLAGTYQYEWLNVRTGAVAARGSVTAANGSRTFSPPFSGQAVLYLSTSLSEPTRPRPPTNLRVQ